MHQPAELARTEPDPEIQHLIQASAIAEVDQKMVALLTHDKLSEIVQLLPGSWLADDPGFADKDAQRAAYREFFLRRAQSSHTFVQEGIRARSSYV